MSTPKPAKLPGKGKVAPGSIEAVSGLIFPSNSTVNSDMGLIWSGANLLPRTTHTVIWKDFLVQQSGYYSWVWHTEVGDTPEDFTGRGHSYDYGTHPFPCDGSFNGSNESTGSTGDAGTVHYAEIAAVVSAVDTIGDVLGTSRLITKGVWTTRARRAKLITVSTTNDTIEHCFWPDVSQPTHYIRVLLPVASLVTPSSPLFKLGCSPWRKDQPSASKCDETPSGTYRSIKLFSAGLDISDIALEDALEANSAATVAGAASLWYSNINPTPTDVSDKSGAGHSPSWATAYRPTLYTA